CNFVPRIVSEKTVDDGAVTEKTLVLSGIHIDGSTLPPVEVNGADLSNFNWLLDKWGAKCIIEVGQRCKDYLRYYILTTSENAEQLTEYHVTGWKKIDGEWHFLLPQSRPLEGKVGTSLAHWSDEVETSPIEQFTGWSGNASTSSVTANKLSATPSPQGEGLNVTLKGKLRYYCGERNWSKTDLHTAKLLYTMPPARKEIIHPLLAFAFLTPLNEFLRQAGCMPKFTLFLTGRTGTRKSTIAALILSFFGAFTSTDLPMSFQDTANSITANAFTLKDVLTCIDDFYPSDNAEMKKLNTTAQKIMRAYGDRTGRGRMRADCTLMENRPPQGNAIITGELRPDVGESGIARYFPLELKDGDVNLAYLTEYQEEAAQGVYRRTMFAYTEWLKRRFICDDDHEEKFVKRLRELYDSYRSDFLSHGVKCHGRLPEIVACLMIGMRFFLYFLKENGVIFQDEKDEEIKNFSDLLLRVAAQQAVDIEYEKPANIFVRKLYALMESGDVVLKKKGSHGDYTPSFFSGIVNSDYLMIHLDSVFPLIKKLCNDSGEAFPYTKNSIMKALVEEGIAEPGRQSTTRV
ncbi:MAG: hypothetical protein IJG87_03235, partial [Ruminococcus sp.]|nr:hypothetical protein [Ruminococcus sp.]